MMARKIVITGAGSGMGAAVAKMLKAQGDEVFCIDFKK
jgi:NAD(P)-dependent dehydrogenase (short-subunit alcohol dehydrogenase family)